MEKSAKLARPASAADSQPAEPETCLAIAGHVDTLRAIRPFAEPISVGRYGGTRRRRPTNGGQDMRVGTRSASFTVGSVHGRTILRFCWWREKMWRQGLRN